jgi:hypothetical protein
MAILASLSICAGISSTSAENRDLGHLERSDKFSTFEEGGSIMDLIPAGAVDVPLSLGGLSSCAVLVLITSPKDQNLAGSTLQLKRNLIGAEATPITPIGNRKQGYYVLSTESLTAVFLSNPGTTDMRVQYAVLGS